MDDDFTSRAGAYWPRLTRTARLLTGNSADADRRARAALAEVYARRRVPGDDAEFYVRRALVRDFLRRRPRLPARAAGLFGARPVAAPPQSAPHASAPHAADPHAPAPHAADPHASDAYAPDPLDPLTEVLAALPPRRRAVAVLRHWDGLDHREVAALLGSSPGAVKAVGRRVLKELRAHPAYREGQEPYAGSPAAPGPVPRHAVEEAGRTRRRQRRRTTAVLTSVGALLLVPLVMGAVRGTDSGGGAGRISVEDTAVRVVTPGERVTVVPGVELWLTKDGTHWSAPGQPNLFHGLDGPDGPDGGSALTVRAETASGGRLFLSGVHQGPREASRVELRTPEGTFTARVLTLAGSPGWSAWYADTRFPDGGGELLNNVDVKAYDSTGKIVARTDTPS